MSDNPAETERTVEDAVVVRRAPRYVNFLLLGAILGVIAALVLTFAFPPETQPDATTVVEYSAAQVFGFLLLFTIPAGVALGAVVALVLDRIGSRRETIVAAQNVRTSSVDVHSEPDAAPEEPPASARDARPAVHPPTTEGPAA